MAYLSWVMLVCRPKKTNLCQKAMSAKVAAAEVPPRGVACV